ncbi:MAG: 3-hydroxyacyl-CoA dehydrogenase NAD-binding domain-containing protein [Pirellula sp.]
MQNDSSNPPGLPSSPPPRENQISRVTLVGAGWTGRQIAGQMVTHGIRVRVIDPSRAALDATQSWIEQQLEPLHRDGFWPQCTPSQLRERLELLTANPSSETLEDPGLVLECVPEQVALKRRILRSYAERYGSETILASNSSYFVPSTFSKHIVAPERFAHFHFHVPIWRAALIDIAAGPETSEETLSSLADLAQRIGQTPLIQRTENTGYVFNWMLKALLQSALQLSDRDVATPSQIDMAWKIATGMLTGPFGIMDQIGLDIIQHTMSHARFVEGDAAWGKLLEQLQPLVDAGHLGVKTGKGFFDYGDPSQWRADASSATLPPPPNVPPAT